MQKTKVSKKVVKKVVKKVAAKKPCANPVEKLIKNMISSTEAAQYTGLTRRKISELAKDGDIPRTVGPRGYYYFRKSDLKTYMRQINPRKR